jgi:hypothetical protein
MIKNNVLLLFNFILYENNQNYFNNITYLVFQIYFLNKLMIKDIIREYGQINPLIDHK